MDIFPLSGRGRSRVLEAEEQLGRGVGGGRQHEDSQGAGPLQSGNIHLHSPVQLNLSTLNIKHFCCNCTKINAKLRVRAKRELSLSLSPEDSNLLSFI